MVAFAYGAHEEVADEAGGEQSRHDVERDVIGIGFRDALCELVFANICDERGSDDGGGRPRGQQPAVNRADLHRAEQVAQVGGDGCEAAPYMLRMMHAASTNSAMLPARPKVGRNA